MSLLLTGLALALTPAPAEAQDPPADDPGRGSPSGAIYAIPLDDARGDAAPRSGGEAHASPESTSAIRSENGFGSSSAVPGAAGGEARVRPGAESDRRDGAPAGSSASAKLIRSSGQVSAEPSAPRAVLLLGLAVVVAVGLGVAARRIARGR
jgi:hypothetical protein